MKKTILLVFTLIFTLTACAPLSGRGLETSPPIIINKPESTAATTTEPLETAPPEPSEKRVSIAAAGDNIIHEAVFLDAKKRAASGEDYNFFDMYKGVANMFSDADVAFINMEGCVAGKAVGITGYPDFNAPDAAGLTLERLGIDVVNIANNHMLDYGEKGLSGTIDFFANTKMLEIGGYTKDEPGELRYIERNGVKFAFLSFTTLINYAHINDLPSSSEYYIPYAKDEIIKSSIASAREQADFVFVSMHWGNEDEFTPNKEQTRLAQLIADCGADVIIGHHPHVLQPVEWLDGKDGNTTLCIYSLGNLINTMYYSQNMVGGIAEFDAVISADGQKSIESVRLVPTVCHYSMNRDGLQVYRLDDYTEALAAAHGTNKHNPFSLAVASSYVDDTIKETFLTVED
jgi:poly-gamma-glutamate synthesis protein (capsule biosynthesis protein)